MPSMKKEIPKLLAALLVFGLFVGPPAFMYGGWKGLASGLGFGVLAGILSGRKRGIAQGLSIAIAVGLTQPLLAGHVAGAVAPASGFRSLLFYPFVSLVGTVAAGLGGTLWQGVRKAFLTELRSASIIILYVGLAEARVSGVPAGVSRGVAASSATLLAGMFGLYAGSKLRPGLVFFLDLRPILRKMAVALSGFATIYMCVAFIFGGFFGAIWHSNHDAFTANCAALKNPSFWDFFYFSVVTITTLGYGDIVPASSLAKSLASIEVVFGLGYITVVFAAVMARLQPELNALVNEKRPPPALP